MIASAIGGAENKYWLSLNGLATEQYNDSASLYRLVPVLSSKWDYLHTTDDHGARHLFKLRRVVPVWNQRGNRITAVRQRTHLDAIAAAYYPPDTHRWTGSPPLLLQTARWPSVFDRENPMKPSAEVCAWASITPNPSPTLLLLRRSSSKPKRPISCVMPLAA